MVFCPTVMFTEFVFDYLKRADHDLAFNRMHGKMPQGVIAKVAKWFENAENGALITSDVSARGMDFSGVQTVVQIGFAEPSQYVQRAGRAARGVSEMGRCVAIVSADEARAMVGAEGMPELAASEVRPASIPHVGVIRSARRATASLKGFYKTHVKHLAWTPAEAQAHARLLTRTT